MVDEVSLFLHGMEEQKSRHTAAVGAATPHTKGLIKEKIQAEGHFEGKRILLADDDERSVFALQSVLEQAGFQVSIGRNGLKALEAYRADKDIDLILMDIMMPKMDGYQAIRAIRQEVHGQEVPIIALTAKAMKEDRDKCLAAGANDYMTKPIDVEKLMTLLRVWLA